MDRFYTVNTVAAAAARKTGGSMAVEKRLILECDSDGCNNIFGNDSETIYRLKGGAVMAGWKCDEEEDFCPHCSKKLAPFYRCRCGYEFDSHAEPHEIKCGRCGRTGQVEKLPF